MREKMNSRFFKKLLKSKSLYSLDMLNETNDEYII